MDDLTEDTANPDPFEQFARWFEQALAANLPEPNAMTLATATPDGIPSARMVLLKGRDARGFLFFSNYESRKGVELAENPRAALILFWPELRRQVRIEGAVEMVPAAESDAYFAGRPRGSQVASRASAQSAVLPDREALEARVRAIDQEFAGREIPRPDYWGGYRVAPDMIEFWQGRPDRLHDRLRYTRLVDGTWIIERLAP